MINLRWTVIILSGTLLVGCTASPRLSDGFTQRDVTDATPVWVAQGSRPASESEYRALLAENAPDPARRVMLDKLLRVSGAMTDRHLVTGNTVKPLVDGPGTFRAMFEDIGAARDHIHVETFILEDDQVGRALAKKLVEAARRGVTVRLLIDAVGSLNLPEAFIEYLRRQGVLIRKFHPIDPTEDPRIWRGNNRDHRKVMVIDGRIAYTGGINFADVYSESSLSIPSGSKVTDEAWRDTHVRITGPAVAQFQAAFVRMWNKDRERNDRLSAASVSHLPEHTGGMIAGAVTSDGGNEQASDIYSILIAAIGHAQQRIWITQAYFAPDDIFLAAIKEAAKRGVDVRLLLPGVSDAPLVIQASRATYGELLESGVRIFERTGSTLHAKTMVVDGVWATVGSANFDYRSFVHNYEINAIIVDHEFAGAMEKLFEVDLQQADEVTLAGWRERPVTQRAKELLGDMLRRWL